MTGGELLLCLNYGGHLEIADAVKKNCSVGRGGRRCDARTDRSELICARVPLCDLIVRTSGEQRLTNFMLWRAAYSELMFIEKKLAGHDDKRCGVHSGGAQNVIGALEG